MFKLGLDAGHGFYTVARRCLKKYDPNETREWELNSRIANKVQEKLKDYKIDVLRLDDITGKVDVPLKERTDKANKWGADFLLSIHNDIGIKGGTGGGVTAFRYTTSKDDYRDKLYAKLMKHHGLKGNRANPLQNANLHILRESTMPSVLFENGFMDSATDIPIIITNEHAEKTANAIVEFLVEEFKLAKVEKKEIQKIYRVQIGAYSVKANAEKLLSDLKDAGFNGLIREDIIELDKPEESKPEIIVPDNPEATTPSKKSKYYKIGDAHIIETTPDNIEIAILGDNLHSAKRYGINGTFFDTNTAPARSPESCVFIAMNDGKALSNNAQFNGWNAPPRATMIYHTNGKIGFRQLKNINSIKDSTIWAIGGYMIKPYMDFKNEKIPGSVNYKTAHSYIGSKGDKIFLIVKPNHMISDIVPLVNQLGLEKCLVVDGGGSSQMNHPDGQYRSTRIINTAILLKEI